MTYEPDDLTRGERFQLHLAREGLTEDAAALRFGVARKTLHGWKRDRGNVPLTPLDRITPQERIVIARRRLGISRADLARTLGISAKSIERAEEADRHDRKGFAARKAIEAWLAANGWPARPL